MVCLRCGGEDFVGNEGSCISQETSFDDKTQEGSIPEGEWKDHIRIWSLTRAPGFRARISILSVSISEDKPGTRRCVGRASTVILARPRVVLQPALQVGFFLAGLPRGSPTDGLQRLSSLRKTGHVHAGSGESALRYWKPRGHERVMEMFRETPEFFWAYVAFPNFPPPEAWWVKAHALRRELETVGEGVLPEMSPGFIPEELLPGKEEK